MPLRPYLMSAASSRAHHALASKLEDAASGQEQDAAVQAEVDRCRSVLAGQPSSRKVAQTLIILLSCQMATHVPLDTSFALVPALELAEGGKTLQDRRTGYTYLAECLPPGHELHLMLVNTIRKDLASEDDGHVLTALAAICHLPGPDLAPAVVPLLTSKRLLEHDVAAVRQRTVQALSVLSRDTAFPLSLRDLARLLRHEGDRLQLDGDASVMASLLGAFAQAVESGAREQDPARRRRQYDSVFAAASQWYARGTQWYARGSAFLLQAIRVLVAIVRALPRLETGTTSHDEMASRVLQQSRRALSDIVEQVAVPSPSPWAQTGLLEVCNLVTALYEVDGELGDAVDALQDRVRQLLLPSRPKGKERAMSRSPSTIDAADTRVLALRCLGRLPPIWQSGLEEAHMAALMSGIDSSDATVRRETLRLLARTDRNLPSLTLQSHLSAIRSGKGTPIPVDVDPSASRIDAINDGRSEAANRAMEVVQVGSEGMPDEARASHLVEGLADIARALAEGGSEDVWLAGVQAALGDLQAGSKAFRTKMLNDLCNLCETNATLVVLLATAAVEYSVADDAILPLLDALPSVPATVQEIVVLALVPLLSDLPISRRPSTSDNILKVLDETRSTAIKHIARRCAQVSLILERGRVDDVVHRAKSRALNDILDAALAVHAELARPKEPERETFSPTSSTMGRSVLRYEAYDDPRQSTSPKSPLGRAAELAMGRSMLVEHDEVDELAMQDMKIQ